MLISNVIKVAFVKGHVENSITIIDCDNVGLFSLPIAVNFHSNLYIYAQDIITLSNNSFSNI